MKNLKRWIALPLLVVALCFALPSWAQSLVTVKGSAETYRGATRASISLDSGPIYVFAFDAVVDPFNSRRVVGNGVVGVQISPAVWEEFPAVVSWDLDSLQYASELSASGPGMSLSSANERYAGQFPRLRKLIDMVVLISR